MPTFSSGKSQFWAPSDLEAVELLFKKCRLSEHKSFLDLGSGDGRVVNLASSFTKSCGFETNRLLLSIAKRIRDETCLDSEFYNEDFMNHSLEHYDFIFIYPDRNHNFTKLREKLEKEFKGTLVIYDTYPLNMPHKEIEIKDKKIRIYLFK